MFSVSDLSFVCLKYLSLLRKRPINIVEGKLKSLPAVLFGDFGLAGSLTTSKTTAAKGFLNYNTLDPLSYFCRKIII